MFHSSNFVPSKKTVSRTNLTAWLRFLQRPGFDSRCRRRLQPARPDDSPAFPGVCGTLEGLRLSAHAPAEAGAYTLRRDPLQIGAAAIYSVKRRKPFMKRGLSNEASSCFR